MTASVSKLPTVAISVFNPDELGVYDRDRDHTHRIGTVIHRARAEFEAFNVADQSLGLFPSQYEAISAVWRCAHDQPIEESTR
jgi:hypothetical protein